MSAAATACTGAEAVDAGVLHQHDAGRERHLVVAAVGAVVVRRRQRGRQEVAACQRLATQRERQRAAGVETDLDTGRIVEPPVGALDVTPRCCALQPTARPPS